MTVRLKRDLFLDRVATVLRWARAARSAPHPATSALVLPPSVPGSLGDEAMVLATLSSLHGMGYDRIGLVDYASDSRWLNVGAPCTAVDLSSYFTGRSWLSEVPYLREVGRYQTFYCIGADVIDGYYSEYRSLRRLRAVAQAAKTGAKTTILGFSFNADPTPGVVDALGQLPPGVQLCARDPVSQRRLQQRLCRPVALVADLAFLLPPDETSGQVARVANWIADERRSGRVVLGVNANYLHLRALNTDDPVRLVSVYVRMLCDLSARRPDLSYVLLPHDVRGEHSDVFLVETICESLPDRVRAHALQITAPVTAAEIKAICGALDFVLSGRMHVAIACLGQGTPVACISYQGKFEGLFEHFGLDAMALDPDAAFRDGCLASFLLPLVEQREALHRQIAARGHYVQELARRNFLHGSRA